MAIHFKFRSAVEYDSIDIEGPFISIGALKEKIVEHKNLTRATDFDLLITNAQTSEEYVDDTFLVPKNTSVIIKRVPTSRTKPMQSKNHATDVVTSDNAKGGDTTSHTQGLPMAGMDSLDDFGVDLYAVPDPVPMSSRIDREDENSRISAMVNNTASDWQRQTQEGFAVGRGSGRGAYGRGSAARGAGRAFGRATPPQGYVCHRCGQPGHFIQHCPTNGDPTYDMRKMKPPVGIPKTRLKADQEGSYILPDGSVAVMQPDETVFAKEADALLAIRPIFLEPPPELKCPLCGNIFKDAVMIPCCQYSFCDKCIRDELIAKGQCPQCESSKFKNDDLLPNINLRQAIDRFLEAQVTTSGASDSFYRQQQLPDVDSGARKVATPATSRLQIELRKPSSSAGVSTQVLPAKEVVEDVVESSKDRAVKKEQVEGSAVLMAGGEDSGGGIEGPLFPSKEQGAESVEKEVVVIVKEEEKMGFVNDEGEKGMISKNIEPFSVKETEGVAMESEVSKGKKKKKRARPIPADGAADTTGGGKLRKMQGERNCYVCGSPDHFARDCVEHVGPGPYGGPHPGMFAPGMMPPMSGHPYGGGYNMEWHAPPMHPHNGPYGPYGEAMHGPGPGPMPFDGPMMPGPPYGVPPFGIPPMYPGGPMHGGYMRNGPAMMGIMDRPPLSREEFLEVQERQRQERHRQQRMLEHSEREWSPELPYRRERDNIPRHLTPDMDSRRFKETRERHVDRDEHLRKHAVDLESAEEYSDETDYHKPKSGRLERKRESERLVDNRHSRRRSDLSNDDDVTSFDEQKPPRRPVRRADYGDKVLDIRRDRESSRQRKEYIDYSPEHEAQGLSGKMSREGSRSQKGHRVVESVSKRVSSVSADNRFKSSKRDAQEDSGHSDPPPREPLDLRMKLGRKREKERQEQRYHHGYAPERDDSNRGSGEAEKSKLKRHHSRSKSKGEEPVDYDSEESKKKKRKHRKHADEELGDRIRDSREKDMADPSTPRKVLKSKGTSHLQSNNIEVTRWQLVDSELDEAHSSHTYHSKRKSMRSYNS